MPRISPLSLLSRAAATWRLVGPRWGPSIMARLLVIGLAAPLGLAPTAATVEAAQALGVVDVDTDVYCLFSPACAVVRTDTQSTFVLPGTAGSGVLSSSTFKAQPGSAAEGLYGYEYRVDLSLMVAITGVNCVNSLRIKLFTPAGFLDYDGNGTPGEQVYVVTSAPGVAGPSLALKDGAFVTFFLDPPVCPGATPDGGDASFPIGIASGRPPQAVLAELTPDIGGVIQVGARAPKPAPKLFFMKNTLLYKAIELLPLGAFVGPTPGAQEGRRRAMLREVAAALALAEEGHDLPAVQLLERLLMRMDGIGQDWVRDDPGTREDERAQISELIQETMESLAHER